eukprot:2788429-Pyramimonas_sp.AAC.1
MDEDASDRLGSDEHGQCVELCFAAEMSSVVFSEQQHRRLDFDRATTMRADATAVAKRSSVV